MRVRRRSTGEGSRLAAAAISRLDGLARQWRVVPAPTRPPARLEESEPAELPLDPWQAVLPEPGAAPSTARRVAAGPWTASSLRGLAVLVLAAFALTGWWWWSGRPQAVAVAPTVVATGAALPGAVLAESTTPSAAASGGPAAAPAVPAAALDEVVVHVAGLVRRPGLVRLPAGSRVADAVAAAGGVTRARAGDSVNLARVLVDGEQILVGAAGGGGAVGPVPPTGGLTDLNSADASALELLPGVGPVLAGRIVAWRLANGPFRSVDELGEVSGIGDAILELLRPTVRV